LEVVRALLEKGADVEARDKVGIARACALCPSRSLEHMQKTHGYLSGDVPVYIPLLLCLKTALRLQGVSAIADTRLGQSGLCH
jgi:hypothetical protein